jgi:hypothetical protein
MSDTKIISQNTARRIVSDIKDIKKSYKELADNGIYYKHSENELLKGYAMIVGSKVLDIIFLHLFFRKIILFHLQK